MLSGNDTQGLLLSPENTKSSTRKQAVEEEMVQKC